MYITMTNDGAKDGLPWFLEALPPTPNPQLELQLWPTQLALLHQPCLSVPDVQPLKYTGVSLVAKNTFDAQQFHATSVICPCSCMKAQKEVTELTARTQNGK